MSTVKQHEDEVKKVYVPATLDYCLVVAVCDEMNAAHPRSPQVRYDPVFSV